MRILVERLLLDLGGLADLVAEVVQLSAANGALARDFDLVDLGGMHRKVRSTPTLKLILRTVKVSRLDAPARRMTVPWKTWMRSRLPSVMR